ncbi:MAG: drug/metabolite transporter (DMT)-like permease [Paracoccaceae bacterium]|jgi:drug/metabolite transporter (DMT)-like permease
MIDRQALLGMTLVCSAASIGGFTVVMTRFVVPETDPFTLASVRYLIASVCLLTLVTYQGRRFRVDPRDRLGLIVLALIFFAAFPYCFARALEDTTSARGALIYACMPLVTMFLAAVFRIERITSWKFLGVLFAIAGVWSAIGFDVDAPPNAIRGDIIMAIGTAFSAAYTAFAKRYVMKYDGVAMTAWSMLLGSFALFIVAMIFGSPFSGSLDLSLKGWGALLFLALPGGALMMWCFISGYRLVTPTQAAIAVGCNPLTAILFAAWILSEPIGWGSAVGFALVTAAVFCANKKSRPQP